MGILTPLGVDRLLNGNSEAVVVQVIDAVNARNQMSSGRLAFKMIISDGRAKHIALLVDDSITNTTEAEKLRFNIIQIKKHFFFDHKVIIITKMKKLDTSVSNILGKPISYKEWIAEQFSFNQKKTDMSEDEENKGEEPHKEIRAFSEAGEEENFQSSQYIPENSLNEDNLSINSSQSSLHSSTQNEDKYIKIKDLSIGKKHTIKMRVMSKSKIQPYKKEMKEGHWFNVELMDQDKNRIKATFFDEQARKFFEKIQADAVYVMKNIGVSKIPERYRNKRDLEENQIIISTNYVQIDQVEDQGDYKIQGWKGNIATIQDLKEAANYEGNCFIKATIEYINYEKVIIFPSCPLDKRCFAKAMLIENNGIWQCNTCQGTFKNPIYRYRLEVRLEDATGDLWAIAFNETARILLGIMHIYEFFNQKLDIDAKDFMECPSEEKKKIISAAQKKEYNLNLKVNYQAYNGQEKKQIQISEIIN